jgi:hypothetical protein
MTIVLTAPPVTERACILFKLAQKALSSRLIIQRVETGSCGSGKAVPGMFHLEDAFRQSPSGRSFQFLAGSISPHTVPFQVAWHLNPTSRLASIAKIRRVKDLARLRGFMPNIAYQL